MDFVFFKNAYLIFLHFSPIRVLKNQSVNALNLIVHQLQSYDEGEYECEAESSAIQLKTLINVVIKSMCTIYFIVEKVLCLVLILI